MNLGAAVRAAAVAITLGTAGAQACEIEFQAHRTGLSLLRVQVPTPTLMVTFRHSVLGTPVRDRYQWLEGAWHLVEEQFEGGGYGLPHAAQAGEQLLRHDAGWRLLTRRRVDPLVIRAIAGTGMQIEWTGGRPWASTQWEAPAILVTTRNCAQDGP